MASSRPVPAFSVSQPLIPLHLRSSVTPPPPTSNPRPFSKRARRLPTSLIEPLNKLDITANLDTPAASGSFGDVFFGTLQPTNEPVVLKRSRSNSTARTLFSTERRINQKLARHPSTTHWPVFLGDYFYNSQTFLVWRREGDGHTLADYLFARPPSALCAALGVSPMPAGRPNVKLFRVVTSTLLHALAALHERGVVHRDVKPANILVVPGQVSPLRLIDFGSCRDLRALPWTSGVDILDPLWAPPEQRLNALAPQRFDVFCVALIALAALLPSFASEARLREFRAALERVDFDLVKYRRDMLSGAMGRGDSELMALFDEEDAQMVEAFALLCGMLKKSPVSRVTVDMALSELGPAM